MNQYTNEEEHHQEETGYNKKLSAFISTNNKWHKGTSTSSSSYSDRVGYEQFICCCENTGD